MPLLSVQKRATVSIRNIYIKKKGKKKKRKERNNGLEAHTVSV